MKANSRLGKWQPVALHEMKVFLSLVICMGLVEKRELSEYWSTDFVVDTPFFKKYMNRDSFQNILSNLHITDNSKAVPPGEPGFDPLYKIRPFVTLLNKFNIIYSPERDVSYDEVTCGWKSNLRFRVYNPAKPTRFGIKLYQVCEASSGYCLGSDIYTGTPELSCTIYCDALELDEDLGTTTKLVIGLLAKCGLVDYCKKMGGVDLSDQIGQYFTCLRKTSKWYKKLFFHLLNVVVIHFVQEICSSCY